MEPLPLLVGMKIIHACPACGGTALHRNRADQYVACDNGDWEISYAPESYGEEVIA